MQQEKEKAKQVQNKKPDISEIPFDKAKPVYIIHANGQVEEGYISPRALEKDPLDKRKDHIYLVFLCVGILSFALGALASYRRINGKS